MAAFGAELPLAAGATFGRSCPEADLYVAARIV